MLPSKTNGDTRAIGPGDRVLVRSSIEREIEGLVVCEFKKGYRISLITGIEVYAHAQLVRKLMDT